MPWTPLHKAALYGDVDEVRELLEHGRYDVNVVGGLCFETPLHRAFDQGHLNVARLLIGTFKADMTIQDRDGVTALMLAIKHGHDNVAHALLEDYQCPVDIRDKHGDTILHCACRANATQSVKTLIQKYNAEKYLDNSSNDKSLQVSIVARSGDVDKVRRYFKDSGCDVNVTDNENWTPLHYACTWGDLDMARMLIGTFKAVMTIQGWDGTTALMLAIKHGHDNVAHALLEDYQCPVDIRDEHGDTVLHYVCAEGKLDLAKMLIAHKANMAIQNINGATALMLAIKHGHDSVAHALLEDYQCPVDIRDKDGDTVLQYACRYSATQSMKTLILKYKYFGNYKSLQASIAARSRDVDKMRRYFKDSGCDVNVTDNENWTPLHYACTWGDLDMARMLIGTFKADMTIQNSDGATALMIAIKHGHYNVAHALLEDYQCPVDIRDKHGDTILHCACRANATQSVKTLIQKYNAEKYLDNSSNDKSLQVSIVARSGDVDKVRRYFKDSGCDVNVTDNENWTPLHYACTWGDLDMARMLIGTFKAVMTIQGWDGTTALMLAIKHGHDNVAHALLEDYQCPVDIRDEHGDTVLHYVCAEGKLDLAKMLIAHKANMAIQNINGATALMLAIKHGHDSVAHALLEDYQCPVDIRDKDGDTVLQYACRYSATQSMKTLILKYKYFGNYKSLQASIAARSRDVDKMRRYFKDSGCDVNVTDNENWTPLHYACTWGNLDMARMLIGTFKADMTIQNSDGATALMIAIKHGHYNVAHALLEDYQCPVDIRDKHGDTVLHYTCRANATQSMKTLIQKYKVDMYSRKRNNDTPLHEAAKFSQQEVALALIQDFGCDVNIKSFDGRSALHCACAEGHVDMVKCLSKYISPLVVDDDGNTPLHTCCEYGKHECVEALLAFNAPVLIRNNSGKTPKDVAKFYRTMYLLENHIKKSSFLDRYDNIQKHAKKRYSTSEHITRIFVLGNPGAGKSSFIATLKREGFLESLWRVSESSVPPHTAGIVSSIHTSKHYGRVLFYDFAGDAEYYSSHAAILENLACTSKGDNIFIIVVDLREDSHKISCLLNYWVSFIQCQLFKERKPHLIILGSHLDLVKGDIMREFEKSCKTVKNGDLKQSRHFMLDCCKPKSKEVNAVVQHIATLVKDSPRYSLSDKSHVSVLLGLLEMDFQHVIACSIQTIISHIKDTKVCLPTDVQSLCPILFELHELGLLFMIKGDNDVQLVLNTSRLTHDVHQLLFSEEAIERHREKSGNASLFHVGIISEAVLSKVLPAHITKEILVQLQYCQVIHHKDVGTFSSSDQCDSSVQSYLFFPALCSAEKSDIAWDTPPDLSYGIGWLAQCTDPRDYFPPRFHHVLFLRLVHRFAPKVSVADQHTGPHQYRCTTWKTGLHWSMREGVECIVEIVHDNRGVVIRVNSESGKTEVCATVIKELIQCVLEAKAEFCHTVRPQFFLLNSTSEADYLNPDNLFAMSEVHLALTSEGLDVILSAEGKGKMKCSKVLWMRKLTHWDSLFPITIQTVLHSLKNIVGKTDDLGEQLVPHHVYETVRANFPTDVKRRKEVFLKEWMNSSQAPPCWFSLVSALRKIERPRIAEEIEKEHGKCNESKY